MTFDVKTKRFLTPSMGELAYLAALVATEAPVRTNNGKARIPWDLIDRIREVLAQDGFDWKKAATDHKAIEMQRKRADLEKRYPQRNNP